MYIKILVHAVNLFSICLALLISTAFAHCMLKKPKWTGLNLMMFSVITAMLSTLIVMIIGIALPHSVYAWVAVQFFGYLVFYFTTVICIFNFYIISATSLVNISSIFPAIVGGGIFSSMLFSLFFISGDFVNISDPRANFVLRNVYAWVYMSVTLFPRSLPS